MFKLAFCVAAIPIALAGCATPRANHIVYNQLEPRTVIGEGYDTYQLPKTIITIQKQVKGDVIEYPISLGLAGDPAYSFGLKPVDRFGVNTDITLAKIENTPLIKSIAVSLDDKRTEYIASAFKLLTTVALTASGSSGIFLDGRLPQQFPIEIDTSTLLRKASCARDACEISMLPPTSNLSPNLIVGEIPADSIEVANAIDQLAEAKGVVFTSACRRASIRVPTGDPGQWVVTDFALADSRYLQVIPMPSKGVITFHSECGVSVTSENVELKSDTEVADSAIKELLKLVEAIKDDGKEE